MYDQSFNRRTLERMLQKGDFLGVAAINHEAFKEGTLLSAIAAALSTFNTPLNPLTSFPLRNKTVFHLPNLANELVVRKLSVNLKKFVKPHSRGRSSIVGNLHLLLEEGVPFRVYRFDVKSFYESFDAIEVAARINALAELGPHSKILLHSLLTSHKAMGGAGIPRGLSLSAILSDLMMEDFDRNVFSSSNVYFYARYVDDIIVVTSCQENRNSFTRKIEGALPTGLKLNPNKKSVVEADSRVTPKQASLSSSLELRFDYLGYCFSVTEPDVQAKKKPSAHLRAVTVDVAASKVKKIKTRIIRSLLDFSVTDDWDLLFHRIQFLTQNFSVYNSKVGSKKLAGIYHSYPEVSEGAASLAELDRFLKNVTLAKTGKLVSSAALSLSGQQKRLILGQSFVRGHANKSFVYFPGQRIKQIQKCWMN